MASKALLLALVITLSSSSLTVIEQPVVRDSQLCSLCVSFTTQAIGQLLNIALELGVNRECRDVCSALPNQLELVTCWFLCDIAGAKLFLKALEYADLDPIYYCEEIGVCPHGDEQGAADILNFGVYPDSGKLFSEFVIGSVFNVTHATGTGEITLSVDSSENTVLSGKYLNQGFQPGVYGIKFSLDTSQEDQDGILVFRRGEYTATLTICEGNCISHHPWTKVLAVQTAQFSIT